MLNNLLIFGLDTLGAVSMQTAQQQRLARLPRNQLAGYPKLLDALSAAERHGALSAERRSLTVKRWAA